MLLTYDDYTLIRQQVRCWGGGRLLRTHLQATHNTHTHLPATHNTTLILTPVPSPHVSFLPSHGVWMQDGIMMTGVLQAAVLITAFVAIPVTWGYYYGDLAGAGDSYAYDCDNYFVLNCTEPAFQAFGSPCAAASNAASYDTGCAAYSRPYSMLHPAARTMSSYFKPLTKVCFY